MSHYPPYTSKYNPIEHKLFCHGTRACSGAIFYSLGIVVALMERTSTSTGLKVVATIKDKIFYLSRKILSSFKNFKPIIFDKILPKWNYKALPIKFEKFQVIFDRF
jgi:hypothetical protein